MLRFGYRVLVDWITGRLKVGSDSATQESAEELGPAVQLVQQIDREGNEARVSEDGSLHVVQGDTRRVEKTWVQLTAAGSTSQITVLGYKEHTFAVTVAAIDTTVDIRIEGKINGGTWYNLDNSVADTQLDTDGNYEFDAHRAVKWVRFTFVSEAGGANATIDVSYLGLP